MLISVHQQGWVHADLKLENVMYDSKQEQLTVIDWGLAEHMETGDKGARGGTALFGDLSEYLLVCCPTPREQPRQ